VDSQRAVTILIVDDEKIIRTVLHEALDKPDRTVVCASTATEALEYVAGMDSLDLALVDKNLAGASGIELVRELKRLHPTAQFVVITAYASVDSAVEAVRLGLYDYITKPFDIGKVEAVVEHALNKLQRERNEAERRRSIDPLTNLPNRDAFVEEIERALQLTQSDPQHRFAVLVLDLNDFGRINDSLGHTVGDQLLVRWVERVSELVRSSDVLARLGADQFTILINGMGTAQEARSMADRIQAALARPFEVAGRQVRATVSVGIATSDSHYLHGEELLRDAGTALVQAKMTGKSSIRVFSREMHSRAVELLSLDQGMQRAIDQKDFAAYFQPIVSVETGHVVAIEALARWLHPKRGVVFPSDFIHRAAETGALADISWQVLCLACEAQRAWQDRLGDDLGVAMSVNVAPPLLMRSTFLEDIEHLLSHLQLSPTRLKVEVTEFVALDNTKASAEVIQSLRRLGVVVCLDDFGTGYASLSWLHQFPVDEIKIDKSFITDMTHDRRSHILVGAAINLAHSLGLPVVGEGVETQEQLDELRALHCEYAQGFLFAPALELDEAEEIVRRGYVEMSEPRPRLIGPG
jgi:diguanylate cyclase (GGDEF)-like protein